MATQEPFVGREKEMQTILDALEEARDGQGRIVTLSGEPGIGKTRCAEELSIAARNQNITVLWGRCHESKGVPPYWPWIVWRRVQGHVPHKPGGGQGGQ